jgi:hypothetical protein
MPEFCQYLNCHNLASSNYQGYCNEEHMKRAPETEFLLKIIHSHKEISTLREARVHKTNPTSSFHCFPKSEILEKHAKEDVFTSSFHCEVCKELLRG